MNCIVRRYDYDSYKPLIKPVMHRPCEGVRVAAVKKQNICLPV